MNTAKPASEDYPLIPMNEIEDEARKIAVVWAESEDREFIAQKHKLASDIMNYARRYHEHMMSKMPVMQGRPETNYQSPPDSKL